jgi:hypothetical protein
MWKCENELAEIFYEPNCKILMMLSLRRTLVRFVRCSTRIPNVQVSDTTSDEQGYKSWLTKNTYNL